MWLSLLRAKWCIAIDLSLFYFFFKRYFKCLLICKGSMTRNCTGLGKAVALRKWPPIAAMSVASLTWNTVGEPVRHTLALPTSDHSWDTTSNSLIRHCTLSRCWEFGREEQMRRPGRREKSILWQGRGRGKVKEEMLLLLRKFFASVGQINGWSSDMGV